MGWDNNIGRTRWQSNLISFSARLANVPGGEPRRPSSRWAMDWMGSMDGWGEEGVAASAW